MKAEHDPDDAQRVRGLVAGAADVDRRHRHDTDHHHVTDRHRDDAQASRWMRGDRPERDTHPRAAIIRR
jgi:hypothetical protein